MVILKNIYGDNTKFKEVKDTLSMSDTVKVDIYKNDKIYKIPLNYGFEIENNNLILYCDFSNERKKLDILKDNPNVSIEIRNTNNLNITSKGRVEFIDNIYDKIRGLSKIEKHLSEKNSLKNKIINNIILIKITCSNFSQQYL